MSYIYKHAGFFKNTREVLEKHELQVNALIDSHFSNVLIKSKVLIYNSTMYEEQGFYFFYKMYCVHIYISTVHSCDVRRMLYGNIDQSRCAHFFQHFIMVIIIHSDAMVIEEWKHEVQKVEGKLKALEKKYIDRCADLKV